MACPAGVVLVGLLALMAVHSASGRALQLSQEATTVAAQKPFNCSECQLSPGEVVVLQAMPYGCQNASNGSDKACHEAAGAATVLVNSLLGQGGLSEVYSVTVLNHTLPSPAASAAAARCLADLTGDPAAAGNSTAEAPALPAEHLQGRELALKVQKKWTSLTKGTQRLFDDRAGYKRLSQRNMMAEHCIMSSAVLGAGDTILRSRMAGRVLKPEAAAATAAAGNSSQPESPPEQPSQGLQANLMELAKGGTLHDLVEEVHWEEGHELQDNQQAPMAQLTYQFMRHIVKALDQLHSAGWVHLDLKLSNFVLPEHADITALLKPDATATAAAAAPKPMFIDLGSAVYLGKGEHQPAIRGVWTQAYASPELQSYKLASRKADTWSLGILFLALRTGAKPILEHVKCPGPMHPVEPDGLPCAEQHVRVLDDLREGSKYDVLTDQEWDFVERCLTFDWEQRPSTKDLLSSAYIMHGPGEQ